MYCLEHRQYSTHNCSASGRKESTTIICPLCARAVKLEHGADANAVFERHMQEACDPANYDKVCDNGSRKKISTGAIGSLMSSLLEGRIRYSEKVKKEGWTWMKAASLLQVHRKKKCPVLGCKEKLTASNQYTCKDCAVTVCLKHRLQQDHKCEGKRGE